MATKVVHRITEDHKPGLQKQLGCMKGILHLFDRRYLLGLHRHNRLTPGQSENGEKEFNNSTEKAKVKMEDDKNNKMMMIEKVRASVESSRNSFSSSCSSTTFSSYELDSKRVQIEWQHPGEPTSPKLQNKQPDWSPSPDIRDVVKESMTREIRVTTNDRSGYVVNHIDSPRPFLRQKSSQNDRKDRNLAKTKEPKEISRVSCDERGSQYSLKCTFKVKEPQRLSLDSKQDSNLKSLNESRSEPGSNKRPSSGVVARLMGLDSVCEMETMKIKPGFDDQLVSSSPRLHTKIKPALQQHEGGNQACNKPTVYGEMEKRLNALRFNTSGKDLRALKQILEAIQMTKTGLKNKEQCLEIQKPEQPCSPTVKGPSSPKRRERATKRAEIATEPKTIAGHRHVNHKARNQVNDHSLKNVKATGRTSTPRLQNSKTGVGKQCVHGPSSSDSSRIKKQSNSKHKSPKIKPLKQMKTGKLKETDSKLEVTIDNQENHKENFGEKLIEDEPIVELAKVSVEQQSPDSVLDAYFTEDVPSPINNKPNENLQADQTDWNQVGINSLVNNTDADLHADFNRVIKSENAENRAQMASPCKSTNGDQGYIREILLASGFLEDIDSAIRMVQIHPIGSLIKQELFQLLENTNDEDDTKNSPGSKSKEKIRIDI